MSDVGNTVYVASILVPYQENGQIKSEATAIQFSRDLTEFAMEDDDFEGFQRMVASQMQQVILPGLLALQLINCKNVTTTVNHVPPKVRKKRVSRGQQPGLSWRTLVIDGKPIEQVIREQGQATHGKALHVVRGHFVTYTDDKPLFGRVTGRFWRMSHTRGQNSTRMVAKEYAIKPPE